MKEYSVRDFKKLAEENGFYHSRTNGSHMVMVRGHDRLVIPARGIAPCIARRLIKEFKLKEIQK